MVDRYADDTQETEGRTLAGVNVFGVKVVVIPFQDEKEATDTNGSVLRIARSIPHNWIPVPHLSNLGCDAIAGATDTDLGFYKPKGGAVVDKDILMDGQTLAAASTTLAPMANVALANYGKTIRELLDAVNGGSDTNEDFDIALTGNTWGANTGTIAGWLAFAVPQG